MHNKMKSLLVYFIISIFVFKSNGENYQKNLDSSWFYINHGNQVRAIKLLSNQLQNRCMIVKIVVKYN